MKTKLDFQSMEDKLPKALREKLKNKTLQEKLEIIEKALEKRGLL